MPSLSIVIPNYNNYKLLHALLFDLYNSASGCEIIVADDYSTDDEVYDGLEWWKSKMLPHLQIIHSMENEGFLKNSNFAVSQAKNENVLLLNTDVRIRDLKLVEKVEKDLAPMTLVGVELQLGDTGWNKFGNSVFPYLAVWFLAFRKSDWETLGGFDERYAPFDFEDVDLSTSYINAGGKLQVVEVDAEHIGGQTIGFSPEREAQTRINQEKFRLKWLGENK